MAELSTEPARRLAEQLGPDFESDEEELLAAVRLRRSCNVFYLPWFITSDLFVYGVSAFDRSEPGRRQRHEVLPSVVLWLKSPEDTVLRKLLWYRSGGESSSTQWRDVLSVLRVSGPLLDSSYLDAWSRALAVDDLLERARHEAEPR